MNTAARAAIGDVSFVVVARNEGYALRKCLSSLALLANNDCEVICVDSESSDDTLDVMVEFARANAYAKVFQCRGQINSAIARNIGLDHATRKYVYFIDGDVEVFPEFIVRALEMMQSGKCDCVTGKLREHYYDKGYATVLSTVDDRFGIREEKRVYHSGGCFIVKKAVADQVGRWDERLDRNQDIDYTLRISSHHVMMAIPVHMGVHHTVGYNYNIGVFLKKLYPMLLGMVIRKNIFKPRLLCDIASSNKGMLKGLFLLAAVVSAFVADNLFGLNLAWLYLLVLFIFVADMCYGCFKGQAIHTRFIGHYLFPPLVLLGVFINRPRGRGNFNYILICP